jgi:hypothetical protein
MLSRFISEPVMLLFKMLAKFDPLLELTYKSEFKAALPIERSVDGHRTLLALRA